MVNNPTPKYQIGFYIFMLLQSNYLRIFYEWDKNSIYKGYLNLSVPYIRYIQKYQTNLALNKYNLFKTLLLVNMCGLILTKFYN